MRSSSSEDRRKLSEQFQREMCLLIEVLKRIPVECDTELILARRWAAVPATTVVNI